MGGLAESCLAGYNVTWGDTFERYTCFEVIADFLNKSNINTTSPTCMQRLFVDGVNTLSSNPRPTLDGCKALCGPRWGYYPDSGTRVIDWVVPIVFLLSNINLSPVERKTMMGIVHALGDPIDTLWSLLDKLYAWHICNHVARQAVEASRGRESITASTQVGGQGIAKETGKRGSPTVEVVTIPPDQLDTRERHHNRNGNNTNPETPLTPNERIQTIATVLGGVEELAGHLLENPASFYKITIQTLGNVAAETNPSLSAWKQTALSLVDSHTNEFLRTGMAVSLYFFQVSSEFIDQISQNEQNTPGGRIGAAMMLSWLIPVTLLSNLVGGFPSRRSNLEPILTLIGETLPSHYHLHSLPESERLALLTMGGTASYQNREGYSSWEVYFEEQRFRGAIYGFRPFKTRAIRHARGVDLVVRLLLPVVATLPVVFSFVAGFMLHWEAVPAGFSCRHVWIITVFLLWCLSPVVTFGFCQFRSIRVSWWAMFIKDAVIGFGTIAIIIASVIGVFNSCFCWSLAMWVGESAAVMVVNTRGQYLSYKKKLYPVLAGGCVALQVVFIAVCVGLLWKGIGVMRWGEEAKRKRWGELRGREELQVLHGFLTFSGRGV